MRLADLNKAELVRRLSHRGLCFFAGGFSVCLHSKVPAIADGVLSQYGNNQLNDTGFSDFHIKIHATSGLRRFIRPRVQFFLNGNAPFYPMPYTQAFPLLEWGMNWCVTNHCHEYLVIHAAVVEKNGQAIILPGTPGSGKSTLCAALANTSGWRLLSDELAIYNYKSKMLVPNPRPVSLKNQSIDVIKKFAPSSIFSPTVHDTIKGSVAHMKPSLESIDGARKGAVPAFVVFPKYIAENNTGLEQVSKGDAFIQLAEHSFNYQILQGDGFQAVASLLDQTSCYKYTYDGDLAVAIKQMELLVCQ
jgi:HprK-related kinase A